MRVKREVFPEDSYASCAPCRWAGMSFLQREDACAASEDMTVHKIELEPPTGSISIFDRKIDVYVRGILLIEVVVNSRPHVQSLFFSAAIALAVELVVSQLPQIVASQTDAEFVGEGITKRKVYPGRLASLSISEQLTDIRN